MERKCKICGNTVEGQYEKLKKGWICKACLDRLPYGVRTSIHDFTDSQIRELLKIVRPFQRSKSVWRFCGNLKVCYDSIVLNGYEYLLKDLLSVKLNFHPKEIGRLPDTATGVISAVIETKDPHFLIEEAFISGKTTAQYIITGMDIIYHFSSDLEYTLKAVQDAIRNGDYLIKEAIHHEEKKEQSAGKQSHKTYRWQKTKTEKPKEENLTPLEAAMKLLGVERPYTKADLRKKRNQYLANNHVHPDDGGSEEAFQKLQDAYELLLKFAAD